MPLKLKPLIIAILLVIAAAYSMYGVARIVFVNIKLHSVARQIAYFEKPVNGILSGKEILDQIPDPYSKLTLQRALKNEFLNQLYHIQSKKVAEDGRARFKVQITDIEQSDLRASASFPLLIRKENQSKSDQITRQ